MEHADLSAICTIKTSFLVTIYRPTSAKGLKSTNAYILISCSKSLPYLCTRYLKPVSKTRSINQLCLSLLPLTPRLSSMIVPSIIPLIICGTLLPINLSLSHISRIAVTILFFFHSTNSRRAINSSRLKTYLSFIHPSLS